MHTFLLYCWEMFPLCSWAKKPSRIMRKTDLSTVHRRRPKMVVTRFKEVLVFCVILGKSGTTPEMHLQLLCSGKQQLRGCLQCLRFLANIFPFQLLLA